MSCGNSLDGRSDRIILESEVFASISHRANLTQLRAHVPGSGESRHVELS